MANEGRERERKGQGENRGIQRAKRNGKSEVKWKRKMKKRIRNGKKKLSSV